MAKGKKGGAKGKKITLKMAKNAVRLTPEGRRCLNLSNMGIAAIPKCLFKLTDLDEMDLSRNMIQKLPDFICNMVSLGRLDLHSNQLEELPEAIGDLVNLTHLNLSNNRLSADALPTTLGSLTGLVTLNLGMNRLDNLPFSLASLTNLQDLGLFDNLLTKLPDFLNAMPNLRNVNTKRNRLPPGKGVPGPKEDNLYLAKESLLCKTCLERCKEERERQLGNKKGGGEGVNNRMPYAGLITPNSVAQARQEGWR